MIVCMRAQACHCDRHGWLHRKKTSIVEFLAYFFVISFLSTIEWVRFAIDQSIDAVTAFVIFYSRWQYVNCCVCVCNRFRSTVETKRKIDPKSISLWHKSVFFDLFFFPLRFYAPPLLDAINHRRRSKICGKWRLQSDFSSNGAEEKERKANGAIARIKYVVFLFFFHNYCLQASYYIITCLFCYHFSLPFFLSRLVGRRESHSRALWQVSSVVKAWN